VDFSSISHDIEVKVTLVARPLLTPVAQKLCRWNIVYSRSELVFILEYDFASKSFASVHEEFNNNTS
jgi:hypothetical protein